MYNVYSLIHKRCLLKTLVNINKALNEFLVKVHSSLFMVKKTSFKDKGLDKKTMSFITTS